MFSSHLIQSASSKALNVRVSVLPLKRKTGCRKAPSRALISANGSGPGRIVVRNGERYDVVLSTRWTGLNLRITMSAYTAEIKNNLLSETLTSLETASTLNSLSVCIAAISLISRKSLPLTLCSTEPIRSNFKTEFGSRLVGIQGRTRILSKKQRT